ncbi:pseudogene [Sorangium cellulosum So ce56]|nr:pseudogene [Sorangium cellulosum So ce56]
MLHDRVSSSPRALPLCSALLLALLAAGCGGAASPGATPPQAAQCDPAHLDACERAVAAALAEGRPPRELALGYVAARAARDADDPWALVLRDLGRRGGTGPRAAVIVEAGAEAAAAARAPAGPAEAKWIRAAPLPAPGALAADALLLAIGEALGYEHLVHARARHGAVQLFPADPLAPFMAGLAPIARGDASLSRVADDIALAALVRRAFGAAGRFRYVEAAAAADALAAAVKGRDPDDEPVLRGRYALQLLATAGVALEEAEDDAPFAPSAARPGPPPAPGDTPYGDLLRVRTARDGRAAWRARGAAVLRAAPADRRAALDDLLGKAPGCGRDVAPPMEGPRDLVFAAALAGALAPGDPSAAPASAAAAPGRRLPLDAWLPRYEALVRAVEQTSTAWAHAPALLHERGPAPAASQAGGAGSAVHRRATELGLAHLAALRALAEAEPRRYRALALIPLAYSPGVLADEPLRDAIVDLTQIAVQRRMAEAHDPEAVLGAALAGVFAGMAYPPEVQPPHFLALQGALTAKLRGELTEQAGWGVAGLYAADALYRLASGQAPDLAFSSAQIERALAPAPALPYPGLAALAASLSRYAALGAAGALDPQSTDAARLPPERRQARDALRRAVAGLAARDAGAGAADAAEAPPPELVEDVAALADGVLAVLLTERSRKPPPAGVACAAGRGPSPEARRALARLGDVRRRILLAPRYRQGDDPWARRARLLVTLLSDAIDLLSAPPRAAGAPARVAPPRFTLPAADAEAAVAAGLSGWVDHDLADALTGGYALARALLESSTAERFAERSGAPLGRVLRGLSAAFRDDPARRGGAGRGPAGGALLDALASLPAARDGGGDLRGLFVGYARAFSALGLRDQADLALLASLLGAAVLGGPPSPDAIALANDSGSRVAWALSYLGEIAKARAGIAPDPSAYAAAMSKASDDACQAADTGDVLAVVGAVRDFAGGRRAEARDALDRVLAAADARGLRVPRMTYRYEEKTATRVFSLSFDVSYGAGLLEGANGFQLGLGLRTRGEPEGSLAAALAPEGSPRSDRGRGARLRQRRGARGRLPLPRRRRRPGHRRGAPRDRRALVRPPARAAGAAPGPAARLGPGRPRAARDRRPARGRGRSPLPRRRPLDARPRPPAAGRGRRRGRGAPRSAPGRPRRGPGARPARRADRALARRGRQAARVHRGQGRARRLRGARLRRLPARALAAHRRRPRQAAAPPATGARGQRGRVPCPAQPRRLPHGGGAGDVRPRRVHGRRGGAAAERPALRRRRDAGAAAPRGALRPGRARRRARARPRSLARPSAARGSAQRRGALRGRGARRERRRRPDGARRRDARAPRPRPQPEGRALHDGARRARAALGRPLTALEAARLRGSLPGRGRRRGGDRAPHRGRGGRARRRACAARRPRRRRARRAVRRASRRRSRRAVRRDPAPAPGRAARAAAPAGRARGAHEPARRRARTGALACPLLGAERLLHAGGLRVGRLRVGGLRRGRLRVRGLRRGGRGGGRRGGGGLRCSRRRGRGRRCGRRGGGLRIRRLGCGRRRGGGLRVHRLRVGGLHGALRRCRGHAGRLEALGGDRGAGELDAGVLAVEPHDLDLDAAVLLLRLLGLARIGRAVRPVAGGAHAVLLDPERGERLHHRLGALLRERHGGGVVADLLGVGRDLDELDLRMILEDLRDVREEPLRGGLELGLAGDKGDLLVELHLVAVQHDRRDVGTSVVVLVAVLDLGLGRALVGIGHEAVSVRVGRLAAVLGVGRQAVLFLGHALVGAIVEHPVPVRVRGRRRRRRRRRRGRRCRRLRGLLLGLNRAAGARREQRHCECHSKPSRRSHLLGSSPWRR